MKHRIIIAISCDTRECYQCKFEARTSMMGPICTVFDAVLKPIEKGSMRMLRCDQCKASERLYF